MHEETEHEETSFHKPPPPDHSQDDPSVLAAAVEREVERHMGTAPYSGKTYTIPEYVRRDAIATGIYSMYKTGACKLDREAQSLLFWNPYVGCYQEYDEEYGKLMMRCLREFKQSRQKLMQTKADLN